MTAPDGGSRGGPPRSGDDAAESELAWLRRESGDVALRAWRLTPERLAAYVAGVRALREGGAAVAYADPGGALDPDLQPALRPWEVEASYWDDPVDVVAAAIEARPPVAGAIARATQVAEFAAAHVKLQVCVRALAIAAGDDARAWEAGQVRAWVDAQRPGNEAEADFGESLVTTAVSWATVDAVFAGG